MNANNILQEILNKLNEIEARLDMLETAMIDDDIFVGLADMYNENDEEIKQHNAIL